MIQCAHAHGGTVLDEDLRDFLGDPDRSSGLLDPLLERAGDVRTAAFGEPSAVQIVGDDHRVHGEGGTRGRQAVVAPLAGQDGLELGGAEVGVQICLRCAGGGASGHALHESEYRSDGTGHHSLNEFECRPGRGPANIFEVAPDSSRLGRKFLDEGALVSLGTAAGAQVDSRIHETVVDLRHAVPLQLAAREIVEVRTDLGAGVELSDVVHAHVPGGAIATEGVRQPSRFRVSLEDEDPFVRCTGQKARRGQSSYAGTDDDGVICHAHFFLSLLDSVKWKCSS